MQIESKSAPDDVAVIRRGLEACKTKFAGSDNYQALNVFVRDENDAVIGGLLGGTYWQWLSIDILWLEADARGAGLGVKLVGMAEVEAVRRGCEYAHVDTTDYQAPKLYERLGYTKFGELPNCPSGFNRYYFYKQME